MVFYEKSHLKLAEFFYDEREAETRADIVRYRFRPEPVEGCRSTDFHTLVCDLSLDPDTLLGRMHKQTRYEVRRASQEGFRYEASARPELWWVEQFVFAYAEFARSKGLPAANRERLLGLHRHGQLDLSRMLGAEGNVLVWHAHIRTAERIRLLHSASQFRSSDKAEAASIGRANRLLHWLDIERCRAEGLKIYDFGGWYPGQDDEEKLRINKFKEGFGGEVVRQFNADRPNTWKGTAALRIKDAMASLRGSQN
jgi:hypothetical protein